MRKQAVLNEKGRRWLTQVRETILNKPVQFDWSTFFTGSGGELDFKFKTDQEIAEIIGKEQDWCGTTCCIAGMIISLAIDEEVGPRCTLDKGVDTLEKQHELKTHINIYGDLSLVLILVPNALTTEYAVEFSDFLFYPWEFEDKFGNRMYEDLAELNREVTAQEAIRRIDWVLADKPIGEYEIPYDVYDDYYDYDEEDEDDYYDDEDDDEDDYYDDEDEDDEDDGYC